MPKDETEEHGFQQFCDWADTADEGRGISAWSPEFHYACEAWRKLFPLLDRARNWVQEPQLRAEITAVCPPKRGTE